MAAAGTACLLHQRQTLNVGENIFNVYTKFAKALMYPLEFVFGISSRWTDQTRPEQSGPDRARQDRNEFEWRALFINPFYEFDIFCMQQKWVRKAESGWWRVGGICGTVWHGHWDSCIFKQRQANEWKSHWIPTVGGLDWMMPMGGEMCCHMQTKLKCTTASESWQRKSAHECINKWFGGDSASEGAVAAYFNEWHSKLCNTPAPPETNETKVFIPESESTRWTRTRKSRPVTW